MGKEEGRGRRRGEGRKKVEGESGVEGGTGRREMKVGRRRIIHSL